MSANLSSYKVLRVTLPNSTQNTIKVSDFAPQGCTVRSINLDVTTAVGGSTVTIQGGGNNLLAAANAATAAAGGFELALTAVVANLGLSDSDTIVVNPSGATVLAINICYGDATPSVIPFT